MLHVENARTGFVEPADFDALPLAALPAHLQAPTCPSPTSRPGAAPRCWGSRGRASRSTLTAAGPCASMPRRARTAPAACYPSSLVPRWRFSSPSSTRAAGSPTACTSSTGTGSRSGTSTTHGARHASAHRTAEPALPRSASFRRPQHGAGWGLAARGDATERAQDRQHLSRRYDIVSETDLREADEKVTAYLTATVRAENGQSGRKIVAVGERRGDATC